MDKIRIACECGRSLRVSPDRVRVKCPDCQQPVLVRPRESSAASDDDLTPAQWVTVAGAVTLTLSLAFLAINPSGQLWRAVGLIGLITIAIPYRQLIWERIRAGAKSIATRRPPAAEPTPAPSGQTIVISDRQSNGGCLPAILSAILPGVGQMASGRIGAGILWLIVVWIGGLVLALPTLGLGPFLLWIACICDAASGGGSSQQTIVVQSR